MKSTMLVAALIAAVSLTACSRDKDTVRAKSAPAAADAKVESELSKDMTRSRWVSACKKIESSFADPNPSNYSRVELSFGQEEDSLTLKRVEYASEKCNSTPVSTSMIAEKKMISIAQSEGEKSGKALDGKLEIMSQAEGDLVANSYRVILVDNKLSIWKAETSEDSIQPMMVDDSGQDSLLGTEHEFSRVIFFPQNRAI